MSLRCSELYLSQFRLTSPQVLASGDGTKSARVTGDVFIHPSAKVHPTAKVSNPSGSVTCRSNFLLCFGYYQIGPNVSISANARVGPGVRLISCIILDDVEIMVCLLTSESKEELVKFLLIDSLVSGCSRKMQW